MEEKYVCIGYGQNQKGVYSRLAKVVEYTDKTTKANSAFVDLKQNKYVQDTYEIGQLVTITSIVN